MPTPVRADPVELAWAAGFFDGEGSTFARSEATRPGYRRLNVAVPQLGGPVVPDVLVRFQRALRGLGSIGNPDRDVYQWRTTDYSQSRDALALLWPRLSAIKRRQARAAIALVDAQYASGRYRARPWRRKPRLLITNPRRRDLTASDNERLDRAWAAGFLDAEGCFGLVRGRARVGGPRWYRIRASASQHGKVGVPAAVLVRLHRILGVGRIERHGEIDDFKWVAEGLPAIERVLAVVGPWLGSVKSEQAVDSMRAYASQTRLKGDEDRCKRGHLYDRRVTLKTDRTRAYCKACARLLARRQRAALGITPRAFRDISRRYTE